MAYLNQSLARHINHLMTKEDIVDKLQFPKKTDRILGEQKEAWCKFHQAHNHNTERCLTLAYQLAKLVKEGFFWKNISRTPTRKNEREKAHQKDATTKPQSL